MKIDGVNNNVVSMYKNKTPKTEVKVAVQKRYHRIILSREKLKCIILKYKSS